MASGGARAKPARTRRGPTGRTRNARSSCGQNRLIVTATQKSTTGGTIRTDNVHLDTFDRPILTRTQLLGGGYSRVERQYDDLGRLVAESAPCTEGGVSISALLDRARLRPARPPHTDQPAVHVDSTQTTQIAYAGLTTTITDPLGKLSVRIEDGRGRLVRVGGSTTGTAQTFDFDAFGNPVRVTDSAGKMLQSATYNVRGLRDDARPTPISVPGSTPTTPSASRPRTPMRTARPRATPGTRSGGRSRG